MKTLFKKISSVLKTVFGYGIMICLFVGGFTFFGYLAALIIGGPVATQICTVIYNDIIPVMVYATSILVLHGLLAMYLNGEMELTAKKEKTQK